MSGKAFKVGEAPWEKANAAPKAFKVGEAPWESAAHAAPSMLEASADVAPPSDRANAIIEGFGQGASMGYLPQLQAAMGKLMPNPTADLDAQLKKQGFNINQKEDTYTSLRDENIARQESLKKSNPYAYHLSQLAGGISTAPLMEGAVGAAAPKLAGAGKAMLTGATMGALQNPGDKEGEVHNPLEGDFQTGSRSLNAGLGALLGYGANKLATKIGGASGELQNAGKYLEGEAEKNAARQAGGRMSSFKKIDANYDSNKIKDVGRFIIDNKIAPSGATAESMAEKTGTLKDQAWQEMKGVFDAIDGSGNAGKFDRTQIANTLRASLDKVSGLKKLPGSPGASARKTLEGLIGEIEQSEGPIGLDELRALKTQYGANAGYDKLTSPLTSEGYRSFERSLADTVSERAKSLSDSVRGDLGGKLSAANEKYHLASLTDRLVKDKLAMEGNNYFSITDRMAGGLGGALGLMHGGLTSLPTALAFAGASKAARTYGPGVATSLSDNAGSFLQGAGSMLEGPVLPAAGRALEFMAPAAAAQFQREKVNPYSEMLNPYSSMRNR